MSKPLKFIVMLGLLAVISLVLSRLLIEMVVFISVLPLYI